MLISIQHDGYVRYLASLKDLLGWKVRQLCTGKVVLDHIVERPQLRISPEDGVANSGHCGRACESSCIARLCAGSCHMAGWTQVGHASHVHMYLHVG